MTQDKRNLTKAIIDTLPAADAGKRYFVFDAKSRGLAVRISDKGAKSFYMYRWFAGKPQQLKIADYPDMTIEQARKRAEEFNGRVAQGANPVEDRRAIKKDPTFGELFTWYLDAHAKPRKLTWRKDADNFRLYLSDLAKLQCAKVTRGQVREVHTHIAGAAGVYAANRTLALVRTVFNVAVAHDMVAIANPAAGIQMLPEVSRERRLLPHEIAAFIDAVTADPSEDIRDYVMVSLFTGARKANVLAARWDEIDFAGGTWRIPLTKNGTAQTIPLEDSEIEILKRRKLASATGCPWVFPGPGAAGHLADPKAGWKRILDRAGIKDLRMHDLRRSLASFMVDSGASLAVIGKTLNHKSQVTTAIYARLSLDPIRQAKRAAHGAMHAATKAGGDQ
jgi:integrase